jgi:integrase
MHIRQLPSGRWRVIVQHDGKKRTGTADDRSGAQVLGGRLLEELGRTPDGATPLWRFLDRHVERAKIAVLTRTDYQSVLKKFRATEHELLNLSVEKVTTGRLVALYDDLLAADWSLPRVIRLHTIISAAYREGVRVDLVDRNPAHGAAPKQPPVPEFDIPSDDDIAALVNALDGDFRVALLVSALTGMRRGELVGLKWSDADFERGSLAIQRTVVCTPATGLVVQDHVKNHRSRRIALDALTLQLLREHRVTCIEWCMQFGIPFTEDRWLFADLRNGPRRPDWLTQKVITVRQEIGVNVRLKDLRHAMISQMLAAGEAPAVVAGRAGHNVTTMARRYWKFMPGMDEQAATRHAERLLGNG